MGKDINSTTNEEEKTVPSSELVTSAVISFVILVVLAPNEWYGLARLEVLLDIQMALDFSLDKDLCSGIQADWQKARSGWAPKLVFERGHH